MPHRLTHRLTGSHRDFTGSHRDSQTHGLTQTHTQTHRLTHKLTGSHTDSRAHTQTSRAHTQTHRVTHRLTESHRDSRGHTQTHRLTQTLGLTDRLTGSHTDSWAHTVDSLLFAYDLREDSQSPYVKPPRLVQRSPTVSSCAHYTGQNHDGHKHRRCTTGGLGQDTGILHSGYWASLSPPSRLVGEHPPCSGRWQTGISSHGSTMTPRGHQAQVRGDATSEVTPGYQRWEQN